MFNIDQTVESKIYELKVKLSDDIASQNFYLQVIVKERKVKPEDNTPPFFEDWDSYKRLTAIAFSGEVPAQIPTPIDKESDPISIYVNLF